MTTAWSWTRWDLKSPKPPTPLFTKHLHKGLQSLCATVVSMCYYDLWSEFIYSAFAKLKDPLFLQRVANMCKVNEAAQAFKQMEAAPSQYGPTWRQTVLGALCWEVLHHFVKTWVELLGISQNVSVTSTIEVVLVHGMIRSKWLGNGLKFAPLKLNTVQIVCKSQIRNNAIPSYQSCCRYWVCLFGWCVSVSYTRHGIYTGIVGYPAVPHLFQLLCSYWQFYLFPASLNSQIHSISTVAYFC